MADITTRTFGQLVQGQAAAIQARAAGLVDVTIGSICRAVIEAVATVALWLQSNIMALLATTRLTTSTGNDVDTFIADWGAAPQPGDPTLFEREAAQFASGKVTFARFSGNGTALVGIGDTVSSADGAQSYTVTADPTVAGYNAALDGYQMIDGQTTITVPAIANVAGAAGNATVGGINTITSAIPGVDTVTNLAAFTSGADAETDDEVKTRFRLFIQALRKGTPEALQFAVTQLQRGVTALLVENKHQDGTTDNGFVYLVVDDGSGSPPTSLITAASSAVMDSHAAGIRYAVYAPQVVTCNVQCTISFATGAVQSLVQAAVQAAIQSYLNTLPGGQNALWSRLYQIAYDASPDVLEVTGLTLNGTTTDQIITVNQVAKAGTVTVIG